MKSITILHSMSICSWNIQDQKSFFFKHCKILFYYYVVLHSNNAIKDFFGDHESRSFIKRTVIKTAVEKDKVNV